MRELSDIEWEKLRQKIADYNLVKIDAGELDWDLKRLNQKNPNKFYLFFISVYVNYNILNTNFNALESDNKEVIDIVRTMQ